MTCEYCNCKFIADGLGDCRRCSAPSPRVDSVDNHVDNCTKLMMQDLEVDYDIHLSNLERKLATIAG